MQYGRRRSLKTKSRQAFHHSNVKWVNSSHFDDHFSSFYCFIPKSLHIRLLILGGKSVLCSDTNKLYFFSLVPCRVINLIRGRFKYKNGLHTPHRDWRPLRVPFTAVCCWKLTLPCTLLTQTWRTRPSFFSSSPFLFWSRNETRVFARFLIRRQLVSTLRELDRCNDRSGINMDSSGTGGVAERD